MNDYGWDKWGDYYKTPRIPAPTVTLTHREIDGQVLTAVTVNGKKGTFTDVFPTAAAAVRWAEDVLVAYYGRTMSQAREILTGASSRISTGGIRALV